MKCVFIVQGEGRGHMTQALALREILRRADHEVSAVLVGLGANSELPAFFASKIDAPITTFRSPNFVVGDNGIDWMQTIVGNARTLSVFRTSLSAIGDKLSDESPDIVVNFYEPMAGLYYRRFRSRAPLVCVGHQYMYYHPIYPWPPGHRLPRGALKNFTRLSGLGASRLLALSAYAAADLPAQRISVVPPLLREEVFELDGSQQEDFLLIYLFVADLYTKVIEWHQKNPGVNLHCFWPREDAAEIEVFDETLTFHKLHGEKFLDMMSRSRGVVTTAGFESMCEAMYLGKPQMMVPVKGQFEQYCNAVDGELHGAGIRAEDFDIQRLIDYIPHYKTPGTQYRAWVQEAEARFVSILEKEARQGAGQ